MHQNGNPNNSVNPALLDERVRDMIEGITEAIDREVARRKHQGLPVHVSNNGSVIDLQKANSESA